MKKYFILKKMYGSGRVEFIPYRVWFLGLRQKIRLPNGWLRCPTEESAQRAIDEARLKKTEIIEINFDK